MFKAHYKQDETIDSITSFVFNYVYDEDASMYMRMGLNEDFVFIFLSLAFIICFVIFG